MAQPATQTRTQSAAPLLFSSSFGRTRSARARNEFGVAEELGDPDQQIPEQALGLLFAAGQLLEVVPDVVGLQHLHAPLDAPHQGPLLVLAEVVPGARMQDLADPAQIVGGDLALAVAPFPLDLGHMVEVSREPVRHLLDRQLEVDQAGLDGAAQHAVVGGRRGALRHGEPAVLLDRAQPKGAVVTGAGDDDAGGVLALVLGERQQEQVDRRAAPLLADRRGDPQHATLDRDHRVLGRHVDVVRLDRRIVGDLDHLDPCGRAQDLGEPALLMRRQVLDDDERHAAVGRHRREEVAKGLDAPSRAADPDDRTRRAPSRALGLLAAALPPGRACGPLGPTSSPPQPERSEHRHASAGHRSRV